MSTGDFYPQQYWYPYYPPITQPQPYPNYYYPPKINWSTTPVQPKTTISKDDYLKLKGLMIVAEEQLKLLDATIRAMGITLNVNNDDEISYAVYDHKDIDALLDTLDIEVENGD